VKLNPGSSEESLAAMGGRYTAFHSFTAPSPSSHRLVFRSATDSVRWKRRYSILTGILPEGAVVHGSDVTATKDGKEEAQRRDEEMVGKERTKAHEYVDLSSRMKLRVESLAQVLPKYPIWNHSADSTLGKSL